MTGSASRVVVDQAAIECVDVGSGPALVFVHGAYVTGAVWDRVADRLSAGHRCIVPTWPFGAQREPVGAGVDLTVAASGRRIVHLLEALDLSDVTLIANDTGGGIVLAALGDSTLDWGRVSRLVFTNCDSFEHFPPASFAPIVRLCRLSAKAGAAALRLLATGAGRRFFASAGHPPRHRLRAAGGHFRWLPDVGCGPSRRGPVHRRPAAPLHAGGHRRN